MASWREMAAAALAEPVPPPVAYTGAIPSALAAGLRSLAARTPPRRADPAEWRCVVQDAQRLALDGWVATALALGWSEADLFGIGKNGSDEWLSLAVWLAGRTVVLMDDHRAFTADDAVYYLERWERPNTAFAAPVMLWEVGR
jgi:hypothetical protein